ncbi:hypothetical protein CEUSTIGMA_g1485.t1 [Chlamydomonas eustigma]|uniref:Uncharacterized protein n=1 Tax=Chlamydomonas eustigma TaxID=1157962 RepID=A0A250WT99_9CHLO|nr:hypothetical protein CEUSTIGMA_g1485.t1 [Chlamydomonas eustigma]|eukprot:GAX74035.1 hypothetical protein CEUSTIGMA_g1485.t1 [Chlamydomonas eustigma]
MQPKFAKGGKSKKNKARKAAKKTGKKAGSDKNAQMMDTEEGDIPSLDEVDCTLPEASAKQRQRSKMAVKVALKTKVKMLKNSRNKMTKLPNGSSKPGVKTVNKEIRALIQEQVAPKDGKAVSQSLNISSGVQDISQKAMES